MATIDPCAPPAPRCRDRISPPFKPGIATRRIPVCSPVFCEGLQPGEPNWFVNAFGTLDRTNWIKGWVASQLFTRGQVECVDSPMQKRSGGWWADSFRSTQGRMFHSGSLLWTLQWSRVTNKTLTDAKQMAYDAVNHLLV